MNVSTLPPIFSCVTRFHHCNSHLLLFFSVLWIAEKSWYQKLSLASRIGYYMPVNLPNSLSFIYYWKTMIVQDNCPQLSMPLNSSAIMESHHGGIGACYKDWIVSQLELVAVIARQNRGWSGTEWNPNFLSYLHALCYEAAPTVLLSEKHPSFSSYIFDVSHYLLASCDNFLAIPNLCSLCSP